MYFSMLGIGIQCCAVDGINMTLSSWHDDSVNGSLKRWIVIYVKFMISLSLKYHLVYVLYARYMPKWYVIVVINGKSASTHRPSLDETKIGYGWRSVSFGNHRSLLITVINFILIICIPKMIFEWHNTHSTQERSIHLDMQSYLCL